MLAAGSFISHREGIYFPARLWELWALILRLNDAWAADEQDSRL